MGQISLEKSFDYFLKNDFTEYKEDEWVAICGEKIVASGYDLKEVIKKSKEVCKERPLFTKVKRIAHYLHI